MEANSTLNCTVVDENTVECFGQLFFRGEGDREGLIEASNGLSWVYLFVYTVLVLFAGMYNIPHSVTLFSFSDLSEGPEVRQDCLQFISKLTFHTN